MPQTHCMHDEEPICDVCSLRILERATSRTRRTARPSAASARSHTTARPERVTNGRFHIMECEREGWVGHIEHAPAKTNLSTREEYSQTADRILRDFATSQWPLEDTEDESPCPSLEASTCSIEDFVNDLDQLRIKRTQHAQASTLSKLEASNPSVSPRLMRQLRAVQARWSGSAPGYLDEVDSDCPLPTKQSGSSSDIVQVLEDSSLTPNALIDALNNAFGPTLKNARWSDTNSDVSEFDLEESVSGCGSTGSWKTATDCDEVIQRRHSSATFMAAGMVDERQRTVTRWTHSFGAMTASI